MTNISLTPSAIADLEAILKHAKQGVHDPRFAKDQCAEIVARLEPLVTLIAAFNDDDSFHVAHSCGANTEDGHEP